MNGEQVTKIILDRLLQIETKVDKVVDKVEAVDDKVEKINAHGCAHRIDDMRRVTALEKKVDWSLRTFIMGALGALAYLVKVFIL